jgi:5-methylcytosine-specific restriction enzyme B
MTPEGISLNDSPAGRVIKAALSYDRAKMSDRLRSAEAQRAEILKRFPKHAWPLLPLERYALGQADNEDTYCRWLEFKTPDLGSISGGSSMKMIVFKRRNSDEWYYPTGHFKNLSDAWESVRTGMSEAFRLADTGDWPAIDLLPALSLGQVLFVKSLHVYYKDDILPIYGRESLRHFLRLFGHPDEETQPLRRIALNRALYSTIQSHDVFKDWTTNELGFFLFDTFDPREVRQIVKIAPGENAKYWPECLAGGYMCVGWGDVRDLNDFESKTEFRDEFTAKYSGLYRNNKSKITAKGNELWTLRDLTPGDIVVANQGTSKVLAIGEVQEPGYEWRSDRAEFPHTVRVKWDTTVAKQITPQPSWGTVTVAKVSPELYESIITAKGPEPTAPKPGTPGFSGAPLEQDIAEAIETLERKGQLIFYGPPGTGKTFTARRLATAFLLKHNGDEAASALADLGRFVNAEKALSEGDSTRRAWWVVANPKEWHWDELFKKGRVTYRRGRIRRNYAMLQKGDLVIGYESTPGKRIAALAIVENTSADTEGESGFEIVPLARVNVAPSYDELSADSLIAASEPMRFRNQGTLFALNKAEAERILALLMEKDPSLGAHLPDNVYAVPPLTRLTFHPSYSYEDFVEGFRPYDNGSGSLALRLEDGVFKRVCEEARLNPSKRYVLLIDEINRANLAKVFGEVITLLERDKRDLSIVLPQSKEAFVVPKNVYLIGTMNTADRSIRLLDAALRRRFAFSEVMPDASLLAGATVGSLALEDFLIGLNERIIKEVGREKQIGHSFLMEEGTPISDTKEFARRFKQEILPLLQEYCYDDYASLGRYLGSKLMDPDGNSVDAAVLDDPIALISALEAEFSATNAEYE